MKTINRLSFPLFVIIVLLLGTGCAVSNTAKGGAIGGAAGGVVGGAIGKKGGDGTKGAIIGAVVGGTAGAILGKYMDKQAEEIEEEVPGATVEKVETVDPETGETVTESVVITFDSGILFEFNSYKLTVASQQELNRMAGVMNRYPDTDLSIEGHTDSKGTEEYNQKLSEQRASAVADYFATSGINRQRMTIRGFGEMSPVASNETDAGRAANRRVEIKIRGNETLKQKANDGTLVTPE
ncbi:OmpA family protein [Neolewinella aurantiaca]|uniref:OmpA family protein n=1 Tax=Neolewinella aurantiaca TaxID=2602767 RepID=A0A5C7FSQ2_9BACT|nr:OmpA family protein [Neolewinella aurantiaca]TXF89515.1 OmpA family protein [Neolewinella aurantiaca]